MSTRQPKFKVTHPNDYDHRDPFHAIKDDDAHFGSYIVREDQDLETIVEILGTDEFGALLGNAWTITGQFVNLSPEESNRIAAEWRDTMEKRGAKEAKL